MDWLINLRVTAMLRRVAKALEESNALARERLALEFPEWGKRIGLRKSPKLIEISQASVEDWNERWRRDHPDEAA